MHKLALGFAAGVARSTGRIASDGCVGRPQWLASPSSPQLHDHWYGGPRFIVSGGTNGCYVKRLVEVRHGLLTAS